MFLYKIEEIESKRETIIALNMIPIFVMENKGEYFLFMTGLKG